MASDTIEIVELGPRDGLQNEKQSISVNTKIELIERLVDSGLTTVEAGAFVSPKWVPQMAGTGEVLDAIQRKNNVAYPVLTPNWKGYAAARTHNAEVVSVFASASEAFSQKNTNCTIAESLERFSPVFEAAKDDGIRVRGYVSNVLGCPYEGEVSIKSIMALATSLYEAGSYEISFCDTIGVGTPTKAHELIKIVKQELPVDVIAGHFHDTYGQALANTHTWLNEGVRTFDTAVSGLGGCPFAPGASGNLATEDFIYSLKDSGIDTSVDLDKLTTISLWISQELDRTPASNVTRALSEKRKI